MKLSKKLTIAVLSVAVVAVSTISVYANFTKSNPLESNLLSNVASKNNISSHVFSSDSSKANAVKLLKSETFVALDENEITLDTNNTEKTVSFTVNIPSEKNTDVSVICMNPLYTKNSINDWNTEQDNVCYIDQITLDNQGKADLNFKLEQLIKGNYKLAIGTKTKSYIKPFRMIAIQNGWVNGVYYKDDHIQKFTWADNKYYTDANGKKTVNKVLTIANKKYAFDGNGLRQSGTKWLKISNINYYISNGYVKPNAWIGDYRTDKNGAKISDERVKIGNNYYIIKSGKKQKGKKIITFKNKKYYVDKNGIVAVKKVVTVKGKKFAFDGNGIMQSGTKWFKITNKKYYISKGYVKPNAFIGNYRTDKNGARIVNAKIKVKNKYYIIKNSKKQKGSKIISFQGKKYYIDKSGIVAVKKTVTYNGNKYTSDSKGVCKLKK